eukprot:113901_1
MAAVTGPSESLITENHNNNDNNQHETDTANPFAWFCSKLCCNDTEEDPHPQNFDELMHEDIKESSNDKSKVEKKDEADLDDHDANKIFSSEQNQKQVEQFFKSNKMTAAEFKHKYNSFETWWNQLDDELEFVGQNMKKSFQEFWGYLVNTIDDDKNDIRNDQDMVEVLIIIWPGFIGLSSTGDHEIGLDDDET